MTERARREYAAARQARYAAADKRGRGDILDEYCRTTGCHRKSAIRRLGNTTPSPGGGEVARSIARHGTKRVAKAVLIGEIPR